MNLSNILFLDIETIPQYADYNSLPKDWKEFMGHKINLFIKIS